MSDESKQSDCSEISQSDWLKKNIPAEDLAKLSPTEKLLKWLPNLSPEETYAQFIKCRPVFSHADNPDREMDHDELYKSLENKLRKRATLHLKQKFRRSDWESIEDALQKGFLLLVRQCHSHHQLPLGRDQRRNQESYIKIFQDNDKENKDQLQHYFNKIVSQNFIRLIERKKENQNNDDDFMDEKSKPNQIREDDIKRSKWEALESCRERLGTWCQTQPADDDKQFEILNSRLFDDKTLADIARELGWVNFERQRFNNRGVAIANYECQTERVDRLLRRAKEQLSDCMRISLPDMRI